MTQAQSETDTTIQSRPALTPYDTGERCEPKVWLPYGSAVTPATPVENFGKVDFDDDEGHTVAVVRVERGDDGAYTVHVEPQGDVGEIRVELHRDGRAVEDGVDSQAGASANAGR